MSQSHVDFFNKIKIPCQTQMAKNNILSSVIATLAAFRSMYGEDKTLGSTNNLFKLEIDSTWTGKCFSRDETKIYESPTDYTGSESLLRVYSSYDESIADFTNYLLTKRKSENGPFKYANIASIKSPIKALNFLLRMNYLRDDCYMNTDQNWANNLNYTITKHKLYEWDNEVNAGLASEANKMYSVRIKAGDRPLTVSRTVDNLKLVADQNVGYKVFDGSRVVYNPWDLPENSPMYRVRPSWDQSDRQILATKILLEAKKESEKHSGYKVFDENGNIVYNIWEKNDIVEEGPVKSITVVRPGQEIHKKSMPVYRNSTAINPIFFVSKGLFFFDDIVINGRVKVCKTNDPRVINGRDPLKVIGYVDLKDLR
ncbi:MAG: glucosaminidase domain-containing protein [Clostridia bacterium]|nr:glucosaminidase domain-containing protein [Clostridia bacterium]